MKYFLLVALCAVSVFIGYMFSKKYKLRANFFYSLVMLCQKFDVELNYSRERLKNIFISLDEKQQKGLCGIDKNYLSFLNKENDLSKDSLFNNINFLKEDEKDIIYMFFKMLGRSDVESQSKEVKNYQSRFENFSSLAISENKKYGTLSIKLSIVVGLLLIVLFI